MAVRLDASDFSAICFLALLSGRFTIHLLVPGHELGDRHICWRAEANPLAVRCNTVNIGKGEGKVREKCEADPGCKGLDFFGI